MKLYTLTECYCWYKGEDATAWGIYKTIEEAKSKMFEILVDKLGGGVLEDMTEDEINQWIQDRTTDDDYSLFMFEYDDGDSVEKFYIDEFDIDLP